MRSSQPDVAGAEAMVEVDVAGEVAAVVHPGGQERTATTTATTVNR
jgi:hypothetical protein